MPFTVAQALAMSIFSQCRLLAGSAGLNNEIKWVTILEILDDLRHIESGEFLITTAHGLQNQSELDLQNLIDLFATRKLAALAIQTGHYLSAIPQSVVRFAEERQIPLLEIPPAVSFKSLIKALMNELIVSEQADRVKQIDLNEQNHQIRAKIAEMKELWLKLIALPAPSQLETILKYFSIKDFSLLQLYGIEALPETLERNKDGLKGKEQLKLNLEYTIARHFAEEQLGVLLGAEDELVYLITAEQKSLNKQNIHSAENLLMNRLKATYPETAFYGGATRLDLPGNSLRQAVGEIATALQAAKINLLETSQNLVNYADLGLYRLIMAADRSTLQSIFHETTAPLLAYDQRSKGALLLTLKTFFQFGNMGQAAEALFIHRHTIRYRLEQIEKLTALNPLHPLDSLQLNTGLHVYHFLRRSGQLT